MKKHFLLLIATMTAASLMAETYTIVFNSGNADATQETSELNSIVLSATNNCVSGIQSASKIYRAKEGYGIKGGTSSVKGELNITLDATYAVNTLTIYAASFSHKNDTTSSKKIIVCGQDILWEAGHRAEIRPYTITLNKNLSSITIAAGTASYNRWYVQKIEFEATNPHPNKGIIQVQYATLDLGAISWESADEPMEDVMDFPIVGKQISGNISLSMKTSGKFTVTPSTLPSEGGEASVSYSIIMGAAPTFAITYKDTVMLTARSVNNSTVTSKLPIQLTIKPQSTGTSTFDLDTTRMAIGAMPGNYYEYAQGTADSTLKNHLGTIICCGKRYRYGSGTRKTWDAFFHTDRDTLTNQVLDMYSNNVRYFDPERPTASVAEFDIEHMLPKSWWGGDVNPAYCDLYHLVPGDYSANRSKSNHAPGIPADSSFNNGSFVTGSGEAYGLQRVFCPADEYKGDFARAYFYIATCYGDSLTWLSSGEPGIAMTNDSWQEFRPWLRDLLVGWHRMDPVSEKEKTRAIEVNKIQGNRNPFIDYPDLVEYIWGNKQGETVDFTTLEQSYGDSYGEQQGGGTGLSEIKSVDDIETSKYFGTEGIVIRRNGKEYNILGQSLQTDR